MYKYQYEVLLRKFIKFTALEEKHIKRKETGQFSSEDTVLHLHEA